MRQVITAVVIHVEVTTYNEAGQVAIRPELARFTALEADIPESVLEWLRQKITKA